MRWRRSKYFSHTGNKNANVPVAASYITAAAADAGKTVAVPYLLKEALRALPQDKYLNCCSCS